MFRVLQTLLFTVALSFFCSSALAGVITAQDPESKRVEFIKTEVSGVSVIASSGDEGKFFLVVESIYQVPSSGAFLFRYTMPAVSYEMASSLAKDLLQTNSKARVSIKRNDFSNLPNSYDATLKSIEFGNVAN